MQVTIDLETIIVVLHLLLEVLIVDGTAAIIRTYGDELVEFDEK